MDTLFQVSRDEEKEKGKKERNILTFLSCYNLKTLQKYQHLATSLE